ncbi:hypothetical protein [Geodermatophilus sp. DSM 45219]|uniref:hypothetical protein n=1 Tax=Geodermatophilus sp. DSM 45219 TaxID=1881103 RepID=UPI000887D8D2|nr:hypothetical protein [Geodermatophilus sp. DSM 45219]SDN41380.1 hypothetical protein SAMN05428965_0291 [Geodermatophilus sp. DSM 45219]
MSAPAAAVTQRGRSSDPRPSPPRSPAVLGRWTSAQTRNLERHALALRPFTREEFGTGHAAPTQGHVEAVNALITRLREPLLTLNRRVAAIAARAQADPSPERLRQLVTAGEVAHEHVRAVERIWDFYMGFFGQRQGRFGEWLLGCDRIALDCYQDAFLGLGTAKSVPQPAPMSCMEAGPTPATFRRDVRLRRLGFQRNPFPQIQLPYHRLVNPWTLGAVLHEVSHNLQNELGLARVVPETLERRLAEAGHPPEVARVWRRWNRETFADLCGLLLGGPAVVASLMDILARAPASVWTYNPTAVHPTPWLRLFVSAELLSRMGFPEDADGSRKAWRRTYGRRAAPYPKAMLESADDAVRLVVDTMCFRPYETLGRRSLAQVIRFAPKEQQMIEEAARRLARGIDPGILPERFLIGAARLAFDRRLAPPEVITRHFYRDLARR